MALLTKQQIIGKLSKPYKSSTPPFYGQQIGDVDFSGEVFEGLIDFTGAVFIGEAVFERATFRNKAFFSDTYFKQKARFSGTSFKQGAIFSKTEFQEDADFFASQFAKSAYFWRARFHRSADFMDMLVYPAEVSQPDHIFEGEANFSWAWFKGEAKFTRSQYHGPAYFWRTLFYSKALFDETLFKSKTFFNGVRTEVQVYRDDFKNQEIIDALLEENLLRPDPEGWIIDNEGKKHPIFLMFNNISSIDQLVERLNNLKKNKLSPDDVTNIKEMWKKGAKKMFSGSSLVSFRGAFFENPEEVQFIGVNLEKVIFAGAHLKSVNFIDVHWGKRSFADLFPGRRLIVHDEECSNRKVQMAEISRLYQDLEENYAEKGLLNEAGSFHYGRMDMIRKAKSFFGRYFSIFAFYKYLSGYGERHQLAIFWLFFFVFILFPSFFMYVGYKFNKQLLDQFIKGVLRSLEVATFFDKKDMPTLPTIGRFAEGIERILVYMQAGLATLAIRNHIKRSK